jgi:uncharacterized protein (DUF305 family)
MVPMDTPESADPRSPAPTDDPDDLAALDDLDDIDTPDSGLAEGAAEAAEGAEADEGGEGEGGAHGPGGLSWVKVAVLGVALAFLGFAVGYAVTRDRPPAADSADVGFLQDMLTHHDQALGVAALTVAYGEDPIVRSYAREVLTFQSYEIGVMTQMLADWGFTREDRSDEAMAWMDMGVPVEFMPGLLTDEQLDEIGEARGAELDRLFLERMAEHHRGGLHMAQEGAARAQDDGVAELAARMERNQAGEINEYRVTAESLGLGLDIAPASVPPADLPPTDE